MSPDPDWEARMRRLRRSNNLAWIALALTAAFTLWSQLSGRG